MSIFSPCRRTFAALVIGLSLAIASAACGNSTTSPSTTSSTTTATVTSSLAVGGSTASSFTMTTAGTVKVTLTTLGSGNVTAGLGVGVRTASAPCSLATSVVTGPGASPQIVTTADAGTYCVQVFDVGNLKADTPFTFTIEHP